MSGHWLLVTGYEANRELIFPSLLSRRVASKLKDNRALFRHEEWELGRVEKFKPYALPDEATLNQLMQKLIGQATR